MQDKINWIVSELANDEVHVNPAVVADVLEGTCVDAHDPALVDYIFEASDEWDQSVKPNSLHTD